jgi:hypothetical protein
MVLPSEPEFEQVINFLSLSSPLNPNLLVNRLLVNLPPVSARSCMCVWALSRIIHSLTHNVIQANPEYAKALEIVQIPERILQFRVVWEDDSGKPHVNRGYRVQVNPIIP